MKAVRILAIVDLVLIGLAFVFMIVMLVLGQYKGFYIGGTVLVALILVGFLLKRARSEREKREAETNAPEEPYDPEPQEKTE